LADVLLCLDIPTVLLLVDLLHTAPETWCITDHTSERCPGIKADFGKSAIESRFAPVHPCWLAVAALSANLWDYLYSGQVEFII